MMCRDSSGNTTYEAEYWPYGEVRSEAGTNRSPWGFVGTLGYYTDEKSKSLYVRARTYLPNYARWANVDPLWPLATPYVYALASPTRYTDPSGLDIRICRSRMQCGKR